MEVVVLYLKQQIKSQMVDAVFCKVAREGRSMMEDHDISELSSRLEEEFACLSISASADDWYIDSGASVHMTRVREYFSSYQEERMNFQISMGNKTKCTQ